MSQFTGTGTDFFSPLIIFGTDLLVLVLVEFSSTDFVLPRTNLNTLIMDNLHMLIYDPLRIRKKFTSPTTASDPHVMSKSLIDINAAKLKLIRKYVQKKN